MYDSMTDISDLFKEARCKPTCMKHSVVTVIEAYDPVQGINRYALGWNGAPDGVAHEKCLREGYASGEGRELCIGVHAEIKNIKHALEDNIDLRGGTIYMGEWFPCSDCAEALVKAGIKRLVTPDQVYADKKNNALVPKLLGTGYNFEKAEKVLREAGVEIVCDPSLLI
jgi:deoxycytidylate deaminase